MRKIKVKTGKESSDLIKVGSNQSSMAVHPKKNMEYNRTVSAELAKLIRENGRLRWLFEFVRECPELDFLIGKNRSKEWISVYRGLSKIIQINASSKRILADQKFKDIAPNLFTKTIDDNFQNELMELIKQIPKVEKLCKYYDNKKEGFYQNELSRKYGIKGNAVSEFVIIDKEVVVSYPNKEARERIEKPIKKKYQKLQEEISEKDTKRFGTKTKSFGNELDFLALDKDGNVLLIEYKHGEGNTAGVYWGPLQVGVYYEILNALDKKEFEKSIFEMLKQKQSIGLINSDWVAPKEIKGIIPVVMISEFDENRGSAKKLFDEVLKVASKTSEFQYLKNLRLYKFNKGQLNKIQ